MRNRHNWERSEAGGYMCTDCDATSAACHTCYGPTESALVVCQRCLNTEKNVLDDIAAACGYWQPAPQTYIKAVRYDIEPVRATRAQDGLDIYDVPEVLASWASAWREQVGDVMGEPLTYLAGHLVWAAHNVERSAWEDYRREVRHLRHIARRDSGLLPKLLPAPCVHCGGTVVRDWADHNFRPRADGLSDEVRCTGCGMVWATQARWALENQAHMRFLPERYPDALVGIEQARLMWPEVPAATWRKWRERGRFEIAGHAVDGTPVYRAGDLLEVVKQRGGELRGGRRVV